jgi:hypothetical protein
LRPPWVLANLLAFAVGGALAGCFPSATALGVAGAIAGFVYGVGTWPLLAELRPRAASEPAG